MIAIYPEALAMKEDGVGGRAYYSPGQAAERLKVSRSTIYDWINAGILKAQKAGPRPKSPIRIPASEVERLAAELSL
jgi:excisionase family DNA binding protein